VVRYSAERQTLTLVSTDKTWELVNILTNDVLRPGTRIECGGVRATIEETDAEWHRGQPWARPCPKGFIGKKVRWNVEGKHGEEEEHEGTVWGWLPAEESDYYPDTPEDEGGEPAPLWRVNFRPDIGCADLDEQEIAEAVDRSSCQQEVTGGGRWSTAKRPVAQVSPEGAVIRRHKSVTAAANFLKLRHSSNLHYIIRTGKLHAGCVWKYEDSQGNSARPAGGGAGRGVGGARAGDGPPGARARARWWLSECGREVGGVVC